MVHQRVEYYLSQVDSTGEYLSLFLFLLQRFSKAGTHYLCQT